MFRAEHASTFEMFVWAIVRPAPCYPDVGRSVTSHPECHRRHVKDRRQHRRGVKQDAKRSLHCPHPTAPARRKKTAGQIMLRGLPGGRTTHPHVPIPRLWAATAQRRRGWRVVPWPRRALPRAREVLPSSREVLSSPRELLPRPREVLPSPREILPWPRKMVPSPRENSHGLRNSLLSSREIAKSGLKGCAGYRADNPGRDPRLCGLELGTESGIFQT